MSKNEFEDFRNVILNGRRSELSVGERVYFDAYRLRLVEVMGNLFPAVKFITDEIFPTLVMEYIKAHPPHHYSVDLVGDTFWQFLKYSAQEFDFGVPNELISDIAQFELAQGICHVAEDVEGDAPATLLLELSYPVHTIVEGVQNGELSAPPEKAQTHYLLYRHNFTVNWKVIDAETYAQLS